MENKWSSARNAYTRRCNALLVTSHSCSLPDRKVATIPIEVVTESACRNLLSRAPACGVPNTPGMYPWLLGAPIFSLGVDAVTSYQLFGCCSRNVLSQDLDDLRFGEAALTHGGSPCLPVRRKSTVIFGSLNGADPSRCSV